VCVDENRRCTGIVSLSDVFAHVIKEDPIIPRLDGQSRYSGGGGGGEVGGGGGGSEELGIGLEMYTC
jgi:hypothetical protein